MSNNVAKIIKRSFSPLHVLNIRLHTELYSFSYLMVQLCIPNDQMLLENLFNEKLIFHYPSIDYKTHLIMCSSKKMYSHSRNSWKNLIVDLYRKNQIWHNYKDSFFILYSPMVSLDYFLGTCDRFSKGNIYDTSSETYQQVMSNLLNRLDLCIRLRDRHLNRIGFKTR